MRTLTLGRVGARSGDAPASSASQSAAGGISWRIAARMQFPSKQSVSIFSAEKDHAENHRSGVDHLGRRDPGPGRAKEDTDGGFADGGWTLPYWHDDIGAHFFEAFSRADILPLGRKTWQTLVSGRVVEEVRKLKEQAGKDILVNGSSVLLHTLIENDLVDEFNLHVGGSQKLTTLAH
jgi:hypothetical protein